ncbi:DNA-formamidopyrimidine glycosylase family protein [Saccharopolyspora montiporae]|uniref:DNA-formamidopyrimidine glycosylase family protein n=1 Tax=Saccharopolyspora montiporae TaxID=2781240 RepID=UPI00351C1B30
MFRVAARLHEALAGERITRGEVRHPRLAELELTGRRVREVRPVGKHLLIRFEDGGTLHAHLRMDGTWQTGPPGARWRRPAHRARVVLTTERSQAVGFDLHDLRWLPTSAEHRVLGHLGPDLLDPGWDADSAAEAARRLTVDPQRELGTALVDQRVLAGIGNVHKSEICFLLGRLPGTPVGELDAQQVVRVARDQLRRSAERGSRSGNPGERTRIYGKRVCPRCGTAVRRTRQGADADSRITFHCPRCQV